MEKERRTKALLLSTLVVVVATLSIAFAAMSRTLNINGIGKMDTASWSVYFDKLEGPTIVRGAKQVSAPSISQDKGTVQDINVKLSNPKDEISYTVDIVNDGTIDAEITIIKDIELTDVQKKVFEFKVTYTDTGEVLKNGDILSKDTTKNITINIKFKDDITEFDLPTESQTINLSYQITYTQYDGGNIPIIPDGGDINTGKAVLAHDVEALMGEEEVVTAPFFNGSIERESVESISFLNSNVVPSEYKSVSWDASNVGDGSVTAWYTDNDSNNLYEVYIGGNGKIYAPENCIGMFMHFENLKEINFNNNFDTSDVTNMMGMFSYCYYLETIDSLIFDTSKVTNMSWMFAAIENLSILDLSSWDTQNVTDMSYMFYCCSGLSDLNVSSFNTQKVTTMESMFNTCSSLASLDVSSFNTENVENMNEMFAYNHLLTSLDLSSFSTEKVTTMERIFSGDDSLLSLILSKIDFSNVSSYSQMFHEVNSSVQIIVKDETQRTWLTSKFTNLTNVVLVSEL